MSSLALDRGGAAPAQTAAADEGVIPGNPNVAHPGAPESAVAARQDTQPVDAGAASPTYNNGLYTPWTPTDQGVETVAASTPATATATQDNSVYLQPTESNTEENSPSSTAQAPETVTSQTVQVTPSTTSTTLIPTTPPAASTSTSSSTSSLTTSTTSSSVPSSSVSRASTSSTSASGILDSATQSENSQTSGNDTKIGMILPVALSLGALALIMAGIAFVVWRRRVSRRRQLEQRRYDDAFVEKASTYDQMDGYDDDEERGMSEKSPQWQTFNRYSEVYDPPIDSGMAGAGVRNIPGGGRGDSTEAFRPRESRRPLPSTPVQQYPAVPAVMSSDYDLDAMMAQSRTGYTPYHSRPERSKSVASNIASSVYSSLSLRSKKSRSGKQVVQDQGERRWNEHGAWTPLEDDQAAQVNGSTARGVVDASYPAGGAVDRPLLSAVDGTPKKAGAYRATSPPESPTRSPEYRPRAVQHSVAPTRGYILHDNPVPAYSPSAPKRQKSTATQRSEYIPDTPSVYSTTTCEPMSSASPISNYPATLQPGQSPALGKSISPVLPSQIVAQRKLQRQQSGTTYSLGGMAGLLYNEQPPQPNTQTGPYTSIPPRKPRKQSVLARYKPQGVHSPVSDEATAGEGEAPSPHRAISAVVRASKARGGSADGHSSDGHSGGQWSTGGSRGLGESQASRDSIDNLLTNVLGPARSPA